MIPPSTQDARATGLVELAEADVWFCDRGDFWGTPKQLCLCARCGKHEVKRLDEVRHFRGLFTPRIHTICDECFETLPDTPRALAASTKDMNHDG